MMTRVIQSMSVYASVAHRYWNSQWSEAENQKIYGRDASFEGIGSNLRLELSAFDDRALPEALAKLKSLVDHQCLFADGEFKVRPSTLENITRWLARQVEGEWVRLTVWESEKLSCAIARGTLVTELVFKQNNLTLTLKNPIDSESGLGANRAMVARAVREQLVKLTENNDSEPAAWSRKLFIELKQSLPSLCALKIDLGSHGELVVHS